MAWRINELPFSIWSRGREAYFKIEAYLGSDEKLISKLISWRAALELVEASKKQQKSTIWKQSDLLKYVLVQYGSTNSKAINQNCIGPEKFDICFCLIFNSSC